MELTQAEEAIILKRRKDHRKHQLDMIVSMKTKLEDEFNKFQTL